MKLGTFIRFFRQLKGKKPVDIDAIQSMGLLAVKLGQIFALRPDLIEPNRCIELQQLYSRAATIPEEDSQNLLDRFAPEGFMDHFQSIEKKPFAAASIGQIHRAVMNDGSKVVIKIIKSDFEASFKRDVQRMKRWIRMGLFFNPRLRKVGNPIGLLAHIEDYTLRELNLLNEIDGRNQLKEKALCNINNIYAQEAGLYSDKYQVAGRVDCIADYKGKLSIIDFKTSTKERTDDWNENYYIQGAAYAEMFGERTGLIVDQVVILVVTEDGTVQEFVKSKHDYLGFLSEAVQDWRKENEIPTDGDNYPDWIDVPANSTNSTTERT